MFNHEPAGYACPFCQLIAGDDGEVNRQADIVARTAGALAFVSPTFWPNNQGHVLVVPHHHEENLYDLTPAHGHAVHDLVREVAIAIRISYRCDGIALRQHNEPAGSQTVWHYHVHVIPRYADDGFYRSRTEPGFVSAERRRPFAEKLRRQLGTGLIA